MIGSAHDAEIVTLPTWINSRAFWLSASVYALLSGCTEAPPAEAPEAPNSRFAVDGPGCLGNGEGFVQGDLFGAIELSLLWDNAGTACEGMARPDDGGARLRFARRWDDSDSDLVLILGISGLSEGQTGNGFSANATLIDERDGRFFSNGGVPNCWVDIYQHESIDEKSRFSINGILYCSGALANTNGDGSVRARDVRFAGWVDWQPVSAPAEEVLATESNHAP